MLSVFVSESSFHVLAYKAQRQEVAHCFYFIDSLCSVEQYAHRLLVAFLYFNNHCRQEPHGVTGCAVRFPLVLRAAMAIALIGWSGCCD